MGRRFSCCSIAAVRHQTFVLRVDLPTSLLVRNLRHKPKLASILFHSFLWDKEKLTEMRAREGHWWRKEHISSRERRRSPPRYYSRSPPPLDVVIIILLPLEDITQGLSLTGKNDMIWGGHTHDHSPTVPPGVAV
ncbi:Uncharacterized protein Rs2_29547 [Raphanus sativus]|nr:Uncharacterized protein Rs2_29547 [Raphanus sativus]